MRTLLLGAGLCFVSLMAYAGAGAGMKLYSVDIGGGTVAPISLPEELVEGYRANMSSVAKAINNCEAGDYVAKNTMLGLDLHFKIAVGGYGCKLDLQQYNSWNYHCQLSKKQTEAFSKAMVERIATDAILGDFSDKEKSVLYSECTMSRQ